MRIWFNHTLSSLFDTITLIKDGMEPGEFEFYVTHERENSLISTVADHFGPEVFARKSNMPEGYVDWALEYCENHKINAFVPFLHRIALSAHRDRFAAAGVKLLTAGDHEIMQMIENKPAFLSKIAELGLKGTKYLPFRDLEEFDIAWGILRQQHDKLCIKPAKGIYGAGFRVIHEDLDDYRSMVSGAASSISINLLRYTLSRSDDRVNMMLMPLLEGIERSTDFVCDQGRLIDCVTRSKHADGSRKVAPDALHEDFARKIAAGLGLSGLLNFQTMEDAAGVPHILEVNSRTSGGIGQTIHAGVNLPLLFARSLTGRASGQSVQQHSCSVVENIRWARVG